MSTSPFDRFHQMNRIMLIFDDRSLIFILSGTIGFFVALAAVLVFRRKMWKDSLPILAALALMGALTGIAGGLSKESVVGDIFPVFLGLIGSVSIYIFGTNQSRGPVVPLGLIALTVALFVGYHLASYKRASGQHGLEEFRDLRAYCAHAYSNVELLQDEVAFSTFEAKFGDRCMEVLCWSIRHKCSSTKDESDKNEN